MEGELPIQIDPPTIQKQVKFWTVSCQKINQYSSYPVGQVFETDTRGKAIEIAKAMLLDESVNQISITENWKYVN